MIDANIVNMFGSPNNLWLYVVVELFLHYYYASIMLPIALRCAKFLPLFHNLISLKCHSIDTHLIISRHECKYPIRALTRSGLQVFKVTYLKYFICLSLLTYGKIGRASCRERV